MKVADGTGVAAWVIAKLRAMASARWIRDNSLLGHRSWLAMFWPKGVAHREPSTEQLDGLSPPSRTLVPVSSESTLLGDRSAWQPKVLPKSWAWSGGDLWWSFRRHGTDHDPEPLPSLPRFCL